MSDSGIIPHPLLKETHLKRPSGVSREAEAFKDRHLGVYQHFTPFEFLRSLLLPLGLHVAPKLRFFEDANKSTLHLNIHSNLVVLSFGLLDAEQVALPMALELVVEILAPVIHKDLLPDVEALESHEFKQAAAHVQPHAGVRLLGVVVKTSQAKR